MVNERLDTIFAHRDSNFDFCRAFLVVSMVFTHVFQSLYIFDYNRRLTFFVTIGFVFISGFVLGGRYSRRTDSSAYANLKINLKRFAKIMAVYFICNIPILVIEPSRLKLLENISIPGFAWMVLSGEGSAVFGFDILPAIALTAIFSWLVLNMTKRLGGWAVLLSFIPLLLVWTMEVTIGGKYISIRLALIGVYGCLLGKAARSVNWSRFLEALSREKIMIGFGLVNIMYFLAMYYRFWPDGSILLWRHVIPTAALLFFVYLFSYRFKLQNHIWVEFLNATLGKYLLFSYIFHIGMIKLLLIILPNEYSFLVSFCISILLVGITMAVCFLLDVGRRQNSAISYVYSALFSV